MKNLKKTNQHDTFMYFDLLEETGNGEMFASRLDFLVQTLSTLAVIPFPFFLSLHFACNFTSYLRMFDMPSELLVPIRLMRSLA